VDRLGGLGPGYDVGAGRYGLSGRGGRLIRGPMPGGPARVRLAA
jgi:hypothetical protein